MTERSGFKMIPAAAKILAAVAYLAIVLFFFFFLDEHKAIGFGTLVGGVIGAIPAAFILLAGYVYADARRRGMPAIAWTALALLIPNGVGFVLYFLLRKPILYPCSNCGCGVAQDAGFCSKCGRPQVNIGVQPACRES